MASALDERIEMERNNIREIERDLANARRIGDGNQTAYTFALENALTDAETELDSLLAERDAVRQAEKDAARAERDQLKQERKAFRAAERGKRQAEKEWESRPVGGSSNVPMVIDVPPEDIEVFEPEVIPSDDEFEEAAEDGEILDADWEPLDEAEELDDYMDDYDDFERPVRVSRPRPVSSASRSNQLAVERERTRRARKIERQRNRRERMRIQAQRDMYNRRLRHERARMVGRAAARTAKAAARVSKEQKIAQGRTGGKRITNEPSIFEKVGPKQGAVNPVAFAGGAVAAGGGLLLGTHGMTIPLLTALVSAGVYVSSENETVKDAALGGLVGSGVMTLIRIMNAGGK